MLNKLKRAALGAHTPHDKATAASKPIPMPLPAQVRILMSQHIGAPAKALVKKGDEVFVGYVLSIYKFYSRRFRKTNASRSRKKS